MRFIVISAFAGIAAATHAAARQFGARDAHLRSRTHNRNSDLQSRIICPSGSVPSSNGQTCVTCPRNTFSNGDNCSPCPAGSTSSPGSSSCGPQPSRRAQPVFAACAPGFQSCPVWSGISGRECLDVMTTTDSCGGCVAPEGMESDKFTGRDCTAIPNVDKVSCDTGRCEIESCHSGFEVSGESCVPSTAPKSATSYSNTF